MLFGCTWQMTHISTETETPPCAASSATAFVPFLSVVVLSPYFTSHHILINLRIFLPLLIQISPLRHYYRFIFQYHIITSCSIFCLNCLPQQILILLFISITLYLIYLYWVIICIYPSDLYYLQFLMLNLISTHVPHHLLTIRYISILIHIQCISIG